MKFLTVRRLSLVLFFFTLTVFVMSVAGYGAKNNRYLELFLGQRLFYLWLSAGMLAFAILFWRFLRYTSLLIPCLGLGIASLGVNAREVLPWYQKPPPTGIRAAPPEQEAHLRVMSFNLLGKDNHQQESVFDFIREENPDLAFLIEVNSTWREALRSLFSSYPHSIELVSHDGLVLSKYPVLQHQTRRTNSHRFAPIGELVLEVAGKRVTVLAAHPPPYFFLGENSYQARNEILVKGLGTDVRKISGPVVVLGDLNVDIWSPWYREMMARNGLNDARQGFGVLPSDWQWATPPLQRILGRPIDYCLVSPDVRVEDFQLGPPLGSDHLPVVADLAF